MAVKTFNDLRADMPVPQNGAISGSDIINLTDTVEAGLVSLDSRVDVLETAVNTTIEGRLDALEGGGGGGEVSSSDFTALQGRVGTLETSVNTTIENRIDSHDTSIANLNTAVNTTLDGRLDTLESQFTTLNTAINTTMDARVDTLETAVNTTIEGRLDSLDTAVNTTLDARLDTLETSVNTTLNNRVSALETTVSAPIAAKTASYTAVAADDKKRITFNSATAVTFTIPASLAAGWECSILQLGVGQVTVAVTGGALNARGGHTKLFGQYSSGYLMVYANAGSAPQVAFSGDTAT